MSVFEITKAATFDAAHHFPNEPDGSPYRRMHGHSFSVEATVRGRLGGAVERRWERTGLMVEVAVPFARVAVDADAGAVAASAA